MRRAAVSVMATIAEGFDDQSDGEFLQLRIYARRSASEVQAHRHVALDLGYVTRQEFDRVYDKTVPANNLISGFIRYLRSDRASARCRDLTLDVGRWTLDLGPQALDLGQ